MKKQLLYRLLIAISIVFIMVFNRDGIQHLTVKAFAGSAPVKITEDMDLKEQEILIKNAIETIEKAKDQSPEYFKDLVKGSDTSFLTSIAGKLDNSVGAFSKWVDTSVLKMKGALNSTKQGLDSMSVKGKNATLQMAYNAEVAIVSKFVDTAVWILIFLLFGIIFSLLFQTIIHWSFHLLGLDSLAKFVSKILEYLVSIIPFAGIVYWIIESLIEAKFGIMTGLDSLILKISSFPDITYHLLYKNGAYTFTDSTTVPLLVMTGVSLVILLITGFLAWQVNKRVANDPVCPTCKREL